MTLLHEAVDEKKLDVRMIERNTARGVIHSDDVDKAIKKLADDSDNAEWIAIDSLVEDGQENSSNGMSSH
jgi:hypothetical protein